ncbi:hypothetical protein R6Q59_002277 [Mikania micrantha]
MESSYLTVDFFRKLPQEGEKMGPTPSPGDRRNPPGPDHMNPSDPLQDHTLRITTPKAVVYCQVKEAKQNLLSYFYTQIGRREGKQLGELLDEDPSLMSKKQEIAKRLELYKAARDEIDEVGCVQ